MNSARILLALTLMAIGFCFATSGCGMARSYEEREHAWNMAVEQDLRMFVDDIDSFLFMDRPSRLSKWQTK